MLPVHHVHLHSPLPWKKFKSMLSPTSRSSWPSSLVWRIGWYRATWWYTWCRHSTMTSSPSQRSITMSPFTKRKPRDKLSNVCYTKLTLHNRSRWSIDRALLDWPTSTSLPKRDARSPTKRCMCSMEHPICRSMQQIIAKSHRVVHPGMAHFDRNAQAYSFFFSSFLFLFSYFFIFCFLLSLFLQNINKFREISISILEIAQNLF